MEASNNCSNCNYTSLDPKTLQDHVLNCKTMTDSVLPDLSSGPSSPNSEEIFEGLIDDESDSDIEEQLEQLCKEKFENYVKILAGKEQFEKYVKNLAASRSVSPASPSLLMASTDLSSVSKSDLIESELVTSSTASTSESRGDPDDQNESNERNDQTDLDNRMDRNDQVDEEDFVDQYDQVVHTKFEIENYSDVEDQNDQNPQIDQSNENVKAMEQLTKPKVIQLTKPKIEVIDHSQGVPVKSHRCKICQKQFDMESKLRLHTKNKHNKVKRDFYTASKPVSQGLQTIEESLQELERIENLPKKMRKLMEIVIQYEDEDGRVLSDPFMKLPTRKELPDYYDVIRKPVDITKILTKIEDGKFDDMDALERDFMLLCANTQKYNEDGSLIHEDSIVLQSVFTNAREKLSNEWVDDDKDDEQDEESNQAPPSVKVSFKIKKL